MIVSGFTQKKVEREENSYGCSLDHAHCVTCVNRSCKVTANGVTACELQDCPRGCAQRYHSCKENEHALLCPEERVACINSMYGCPATLHRRKLAEHLNICPASTVHCQAEWNRVCRDPFPQCAQQAMVMKKTYLQCGQLDTALAMRDQRALVDRLLNPAESPTASPGSLMPEHCAPSSAPAPVTSSSDLDLPPPVLPDQWGCGIRQMKKAAVLSKPPSSDSPIQPATSLSSSSSLSAVSSFSNRVSDSREEAWQTERGGGGCPGRCGDADGGQEGGEGGQALGSVLSLRVGVECLARYLPKPHAFTFLCGQDVRRREFASHFHAVHTRIQAEVGGWMEQRCPLAARGCPFSFRRLTPGQPHTTLRHSGLLESFGLTSLPPSSSADLSHQLPSRLLPSFPETADSLGSALRGRGDRHGDGLTRCPSAGHSQVSSDVASSSTVWVKRRGTGGEEVQWEEASSSAPDCQLSQKEADTPGRGPPLSGSSDRPHSPHAFSSAPNSVRSEDEGKGQLLNPPPDQEPGSPAQQGEGSGEERGERHPHSGQVLTENSDVEAVHGHSGLPPSSTLSPSAPPLQVPVIIPNGPSPTATPASFTSPPPPPPPPLDENSGVVYTGITANSCIRVDTSTGPTGDEGAEVRDHSSSALQLGDLPSEIFRHLILFLDSFSLYNLSLVSHSMREVCCTLLQERGMVSLVWNKQLLGNKVIWRIGGKSWKFSTAFDPVESWRFTGHNPIPAHLLTCPYNQDRVEHRQRFSLVPLNEVPLSVQIRDMLQELLQQRRRADCSRWYIAAIKKYFGPLGQRVDNA